MNQEVAVGGAAAPDKPKSPDFTIGDCIKEGWAQVAGSKWLYWSNLLIMFGVGVAFGIIQFMVVGDQPAEESLAGIALNILSSAVSAILGAGILLVAIKRVRGEQASSTTLFEAFGQWLNICIAAVLMSILIVIGCLLLILPGIYLMVGYMFAPGLVARKGLGAWQAMELSRKVVHQRWFSYFGLIVVLTIINFLAAIPLCLGLIWTIPLTYNVWGKRYVDAFE